MTTYVGMPPELSVADATGRATVAVRGFTARTVISSRSAGLDAAPVAGASPGAKPAACKRWPTCSAVGRDTRSADVPGNAEVQQVRRTKPVQSHVGRRQVGMHDVFAVRVAQCIGDQADRPQHLLNRLTLQVAKERSIEVLQSEERPVRFIVKVEYAHDVRMHEPAGQAPLLLKQLALPGIAAKFGLQEFKGQRTVSAGIGRQPDIAHAAGADWALQRVSASQTGAFGQFLHGSVDAQSPLGADLAGTPTSTSSEKPVSSW